MTRVLMVCTGNICRSLMAHAVLDQRAREAGVDIVVDSAGVSDEEAGNRPDPRAQRVLREHGYEVPDHRARQVRAEDFADFDLILAMTDTHLARLQRLHRRAGAAADVTIALYRDWDPDGTGQVPDPWYGDYSDFIDTLECIERVTPRLLEDLRA
ncbi:low molecular weight phosphotyrosine protein phosphatase [Nanchangia anserum]|uniref:protein-tyrosine-phosphatase n=1 Tax=Nanchangia anserum TaxID=2692125 RepID=A0A8I0GG13_9ACTO|nr:low molecular weight protein-tyrosine-phosphatase [Nanchangia anserum]MBD3689359.1 low molecular weight phosphotyrosine protein phosphatase [Nanchangia anserum]QOX81565.1 low molecular weight phosphotyrosine protein phosphatase [Nanchangia anserum]